MSLTSLRVSKGSFDKVGHAFVGIWIVVKNIIYNELNCVL